MSDDTSHILTGRIRIIYAIILAICIIAGIKLFYLQVIRHDHYSTAARKGQLSERQLPATRGIIEAYSSDQVVPLVLNETKYTLFADPVYIDNVDEASSKLAAIIKEDSSVIREKLKTKSRYVILAKKLDKEAKNKIEELEIKGVGTRESIHRTYPHGQLAAQLLGFVNDEGVGNYGIEQALDEELKGTPGLLRAITDIRGVPLATNQDNVLVQPADGKRVRLTIDIRLQQKVEEVLQNQVKHVRGKSGSAIVIDANSGAIKAMANYPSYDPSNFTKVKDPDLFNNAVVSDALEPGSVMKPLLVAAAIDSGAINRDTTYYDPNQWTIDGFTITNAEVIRGAGNRNVQDVLTQSINTGIVWIMMQMGGGELNQQVRSTWYDYMTNHYRFGKSTGVEQGYESSGIVPDPKKGYGLNLKYASTGFGLGVSVTLVQHASAFASIINGGNYYQPHLVESDADRIVGKDVVSPNTSEDMVRLLSTAFKNTNWQNNDYGHYIVGGKTGSAQIVDPNSGYSKKYNGTYVGFIGDGKPQYVIMSRVERPQISGYAGTEAAKPIFEGIALYMVSAFKF